MEFEQIIKRLDWLDEEHRKDTTTLLQIAEKISGFEASFSIINQQIKDLSRQVSRFTPTSARVDQFDQTVSNYRNELVKRVEETESQFSKKISIVDKRYRLEFDGINKSLEGLQKSSDMTELTRKLDARIREENRVSRVLTELDAKISQAVSMNNDIMRSTSITDENQRQESKKLADFQADFGAIRKRIDELRKKIEVMPDSIRRVESRLAEIITSETERRQSQKAFIEQQAILQVDRDQVQKEVKDRLERMTKQSQLLEGQLQEWDTAQRAVKRAQDIYEEITQKFERRINEITEMQRLAEDRFRQEWVTFKADHQKRWTSYTLTQDEQNRDMQTELQKLMERLTGMEDMTQTQQDLFQQTREANEEYYHGLLAQIHELLTAYERIMGQSH